MDTHYRALVIDDEKSMRESCSRVLSKAGFEVTTSADGHGALKLIDKWVYDLIILDLVIPGSDGLELLKQIKAKAQEALVIVISGYGTVQSAVEAMKLGAYNFLSKPFTPNELRKVVGQALEKRRQALEHLYLRQNLENRRHWTRIFYRSQAMAKIMELVERVAPTDSTVLLTGESGTGKSLIAQRIHELSERADRPFVTVDCGALVENLFESELFGHVKGAFTGANSNKIGKIELSHTGTIFLDEISNISLDIQAKLLKAVDDRVIFKVGSNRTIRVDVRIIAATNQDLQEIMAAGRFREDLFYRLNVVSIRVPPLRERREDVPALMDLFLNLYNRRQDSEVMGFSPEAMQLLLDYDWPGNVRELANLAERLEVLRPQGIIKREDLDFVGWRSPYRLPNGGTGLTLEEVERDHILRILRLRGGRRGETARTLGIDRKTLRAKIKKYGLD